MSRTGLYWEDRAGQLCCAHGVILYGRSCANCERGDLPDTLTPFERANPRPFISEALRSVIAGQTAKFHDGGFVPGTMRATGFDTASGPDRTAFAFQRANAGGKTYHFTVDDITTDYEFRQAINGDEERLEAMQAAMSAATRKIAEEIAEAARRGEGWGGPYDTSKRWQHSRGDPRTRDSHWGGPPRARVPEIITDPTDTRGVNARRVGPGA